MGVLGIDALPHPNPKVLYNPGVHIIQLLFSLVRLPWSNFKRLPHHFLHSYGKGWSPSSDRISYRQVFFFKMVLPRNCTALYTNLFSGVGAEYHETIACSLCPAFTAVHAPYARELLGKQVFFSLQKWLISAHIYRPSLTSKVLATREREHRSPGFCRFFCCCNSAF